MDGQRAALWRVEVGYDGQHLLLRDERDGSELARWPLASLRTEGHHEEHVLHLECADQPGAELRIRGADALRELRQLGLGRSPLPRSAGRRLWLALGMSAAIAAVATAVWIGVTPVSRAIAQRIPMETERELVGGIEERLEPSFCTGRAGTGALRRLGARLLGEGHPPPRVHVVNLASPNAFALPGGTVILTRGLIEAAEGPDEVAGVLAHELAHVLERHVMTGLVRATLLSALWAVSVGDFSGMMVVDPSTAFQIATLRFSRRDEAEADRRALSLLRRARIDPSGFARFFERTARESEVLPQWLSSHPPSAERARLAALGAEPDPARRPALGKRSWAEVRAACEDAPPPREGLGEIFF